MPRVRLPHLFARGLAGYLVLALAPTPVVLSWFLAQTSVASATEEAEAASPARPDSLTDLAPPQPMLASTSADGPNARLTRMGLEPKGFSLEDQRRALAVSGLDFESDEQARAFELEHLTKQLGSKANAEALIRESEKPISVTRSLHSPEAAPVIPDPFVPLPARPDYKRPRAQETR